jgi:hypothetical protein
MRTKKIRNRGLHCFYLSSDIVRVGGQQVKEDEVVGHVHTWEVLAAYIIRAMSDLMREAESTSETSANFY